LTCLIIINEAPGSGERAHNALRLATALTADVDTEVRLFFMGDGARCATANQPETSNGQNIEWMLQRFLAGHRQAGVCRTCREARAITEDQLIPGAHQINLEELCRWTRESERVLVF
jgi:uncharacterized protein involved in oxidation of intracellular sulfur